MGKRMLQPCVVGSEEPDEVGRRGVNVVTVGNGQRRDEGVEPRHGENQGLDGVEESGQVTAEKESPGEWFCGRSHLGAKPRFLP